MGDDMNVLAFLIHFRREIQAGPAAEPLTRFELNAILERAIASYLDEQEVRAPAAAASPEGNA